MKGLGIHVGRFGLYAYARSFSQYKQYFIAPAPSIEIMTESDYKADLEVKFFCWAVGLRFIWLKRG